MKHRLAAGLFLALLGFPLVIGQASVDTLATASKPIEETGERMAAGEPNVNLEFASDATAPFELAGRSRIPLWVKLAYTAYLAVLIPFYLRAYGPTNFLYFCDVALLMGLVALWTENSLLASMPAVGILLPQLLWCVDFALGLAGLRLTGMTAYMFNPNLSLFMRGLSFFHLWLPFFLLWMLSRLGYDRRAFLYWTVLATALSFISYYLMPAPPPPPDNPNLPVNINYVYGPSDEQRQQWLPPLAFFLLMTVFMPVCIYFPTHLVLSHVFEEPRTK